MVSAASPSTDLTSRWQHPAPLSTASRSQTLLASQRIASAQIWLIATDQLVVPIQPKKALSLANMKHALASLFLVTIWKSFLAIPWNLARRVAMNWKHVWRLTLPTPTI